MITSVSNEKIKEISTLMKKPSFRKERGLFPVEGIKMVREIPEQSIESLYMSDSFSETREARELMDGVFAGRYEIISDRLFDRISDTKTPQGVLAFVRMPGYTMTDCLGKEKNDVPALLILERIQDPGNLGTILRMSEAAGITGVVMDRDTVDIFNPKVVRSTMGAIFRVPFILSDNLPETIDEIKRAGVTVYAAHLKGQESYVEEDYRKPTAFMIGNESRGLSDEIAELADKYVKIPMKGEVESLNAAVAATVLSYEMARQRF